ALDHDGGELAKISLRAQVSLEDVVLVVSDRPRVLRGLGRGNRESKDLAVLVAHVLPAEVPVQSGADRDAAVRLVFPQQDRLVERGDCLRVDALPVEPREEPHNIPSPDEDGLLVPFEGRLGDRAAGFEPDVRAELRALVEPLSGHAIPPPREEPSDSTHPALFVPDELTHLVRFPRGCERTPGVRSRVSCLPTTRKCSPSSRAFAALECDGKKVAAEGLPGPEPPSITGDPPRRGVDEVSSRGSSRSSIETRRLRARETRIPTPGSPQVSGVGPKEP